MTLTLQTLAARFFARLSSSRLAASLALAAALSGAVHGPSPARADDYGMGGMGGGYGGGGGFDWVPLVEGILNNIPQDDYYEEPYYEQPNYYPPQYQQPNYYPPQQQQPAAPRNVAPRNQAPVVAVKPGKNTILGLSVLPLTEAKIAGLTDAAAKESADLIRDIKNDKARKELAETAIKSLAGKLTPKEQEDLKKALEEGRSEDVKKLLEGKGVDPAIASSLESLAQVNGYVNRLNAANLPSAAELQALTASIDRLNGQLADFNRQIADLNRAIAQQAAQTQQLINALNRQTAAINRLGQAINQLNRNRILINLLGRARPGVARIPRGNGVVIVRSPAMRPGTVSPMGPGAVLAGPRMGSPRGSNTPSRVGPTTIATGNVWADSGMAVAKGQPVVESKIAVDRGLVLLNQTETPVGFVLENETFDLPSANFRTFDVNKATITFDRGSGETATYSLNAGTYEFTATDKGWELYRKTYKTTINNAGNPNTFQFVAANKTVSLAGGESQDLTTDYALAMKFDNGQGETKEKRLFGGTYRVGTNSAEGTLDLFEGAAFEQSSEEPGELLAASDPETRELIAQSDPAQLEIIPDPSAGESAIFSQSQSGLSLRSDESATLIAPPQE